MAEGTRTLVVMRHAQAETSAPTDAERPLAEQGHRDAAATGTWLRDTGIEPQAALVSAARRTRETWQDVCRAAGWDLEPDIDAGLYAADVDTALDLVRLVPDEVTTAVVLGHNPTVASLAHALDGGEGAVEAGLEMAVGAFPPSATAVLTFAGSWADLAPGTAALAGYHVGRG